MNLVCDFTLGSMLVTHKLNELEFLLLLGTIESKSLFAKNPILGQIIFIINSFIYKIIIRLGSSMEFSGHEYIPRL